MSGDREKWANETLNKFGSLKAKLITSKDNEDNIVNKINWFQSILSGGAGYNDERVKNQLGEMITMCDNILVNANSWKELLISIKQSMPE